MATVKEREYLFTVDNFKKPVILDQKKAIGLLLTRLILLQPGSNPLFPEMGVGIENYRFSMDKIPEIQEKIKTQIKTFLPCFPASDVKVVNTDDHVCNIEITIDDTIYVYNSLEAPVQLTLDNINNL